MLKDPVVVYAEDYHEFYSMEDVLNTVFPGNEFTVDEMGYCKEGNGYAAVVYCASTLTKAVTEFIRKWRIANEDEWED